MLKRYDVVKEIESGMIGYVEVDYKDGTYGVIIGKETKIIKEELLELMPKPEEEIIEEIIEEVNHRKRNIVLASVIVFIIGFITLVIVANNTKNSKAEEVKPLSQIEIIQNDIKKEIDYQTTEFELQKKLNDELNKSKERVKQSDLTIGQKKKDLFLFINGKAYEETKESVSK